MIDEEGKIVCANANMVNTLHLKNPGIEGTSFLDLLHPVNRTDFKAAINGSAKGNPPVQWKFI